MKINTKVFNKMNFIRNYRTSAKRDLILKPELKEVLSGSMIGDLYAERKNDNCNTRIQFHQSSINKLYIDHLFDLFKDYCGSKPILNTYFDSRPNKNKEYSSIKFATLS